MNTAVALRNVTFSYPRYSSTSERLLFDNLETVFQSGMIHAVFGKPESGKTTLGRIIAGLVPAFSGGAISGSVFIGQNAVLTMRASELVEQVGIVFQDPDEQLLMPQVEDEIAFPLESLGMIRSQIHERLEAETAYWDLDDFRSVNPGTLSGGEKKRLLLAVLCAVNPAVWILDETFEELDEQWREVLMKRAVESERTVIILASKHIDLYDLYVSTWSILENRKLLQGAREEVLHRLGDNWQLKRVHPVISYAGIGTNGRPQPVLAVKNLTYTYPRSNSDFTLFVDQLEIPSGRVTAFCGPNGSGKSTLSKLLCGLLVPDQGEILYAGKGETLRKASPGMLQKYTGYLFQNPDHQIFLPSVKEELMHSLLQAGVDRVDARSQAINCAHLFGLSRMEETPATMSFGARKRLQAAVCYQLDRSCMIFDEADSGILLSEYLRIIDLFLKRNISLILITHDMRIAERLADTIVEFQDGRAREAEPAEQGSFPETDPEMFDLPRRVPNDNPVQDFGGSNRYRNTFGGRKGRGS